MFTIMYDFKKEFIINNKIKIHKLLLKLGYFDQVQIDCKSYFIVRKLWLNKL